MPFVNIVQLPSNDPSFILMVNQHVLNLILKRVLKFTKPLD